MTSDDHDTLSSFSGTARLFPLPDLVLFPHILQGLHIFEPRYRQMTEEALSDDRLIAMALLKPGWEEDSSAVPAIHAVACLGHIAVDRMLPDGRYHLQLRGLARIRIESEVENGKLYRSARAKILDDLPIENPVKEAGLRIMMKEIVPHWWPAMAGAYQMLQKLLDSDLSIGSLADVFSYALPVPVGLKQEMLECLDVEQRATRLLAHLNANKHGSESRKARGYPPRFSDN